MISKENKDDSQFNFIDEINSLVKSSNKKRSNYFWEKIKYYYSKYKEAKLDFFKKTPLLSYSFKRIVYSFITLYIAIAVIYFLLSISLTEETIMNDFDYTKPIVKPYGPEWSRWVENKKIAFGLDGSMIEQILRYWKNITPFIPKKISLPIQISFTGIRWGKEETRWFWLGLNLNRLNGTANNFPVLDTFKKAMPISFMIGMSSVVLSYFVGIPIGIIAAKNKENPKDQFISWFFLILIASPAMILVTLFWLFTVRYLGSKGVWNQDYQTNLFAILALSILTIPSIVISTRRYVIDEMTADYTKFAKSKGLSSSYIFYIHIFRNAGIRIIRVIPSSIILSLFGSSLLIERFWSAPGMSKYILSGVSTNDIFIVLGYVTLSASVGVFASLLSDLLLVILDPRVKLHK
ncbi:oligopeptide ABC transporter permease OppB [Spiroplasma turonicum]|uniref:Oligopeptide ABC transporter permease component n=1 Tax=Spiroplasma turonicum TaxID=216946 RepID=A0A0K1P673_9MOLU|nr:oligopeptide ABC transporter permease OppB [Spiroplasma turonicum]AKU79801.1 oligopeptide ABC transporter permease component [Spiroplasma turonicum]ALX70819.1 oligopeptide ABC transporter permease [Spiroplasma turonicum]